MKKRLFIAPLLVFLMIGILATSAKPADVPRMTKDELKGMLENPDLVILDVRAKKDWKDSDSKIQGAIREDPDSVKSWSEKYSKDKTLVLYCAWPSEGTSASVAQKLIDRGFTKVYALKGGWKEWHKANYPTEKK